MECSVLPVPFIAKNLNLLEKNLAHKTPFLVLIIICSGIYFLIYTKISHTAHDNTIQYILLHASAAAHQHQGINSYLKPRKTQHIFNNKIQCISIISVAIFIKKGKVHPLTGNEYPEGEETYYSTLTLTSALGMDGWLRPRPGHFTPGNVPLPTLY